MTTKKAYQFYFDFIAWLTRKIKIIIIGEKLKTKNIIYNL